MIARPACGKANHTVVFEDGQILTQYKNIAAVDRERGNSATFGIEMHTGTVALMYSNDVAILPVEPAVTTIRYVRLRSSRWRERGNSSTIGSEDHTGTIALEFSMNEAVLPVEPAITSIVYRPPGTP